MHNFNNDIEHTQKQQQLITRLHMQTIDHAHFRHLTMDNNDTKARHGWFFYQKSLK